MARLHSNRNSMDGFVPNGQGRHVGFDGPRRSPGRHAGAIPPRSVAPPNVSARLRTRRPGVHADPPAKGGLQYPAQYQNLGTLPGLERRQIGAPRQDSTEFTPYASAGGFSSARSSARPSDQMVPLPGAGTGRQRGRAGKRAGRQRQTTRADKPSLMRRIGWKKLIKRTAAMTAIFALLIGGWMGWQFFENSRKVFGGDSNVLGFLSSKQLRGEDQGQVNVLMAGVSTDDPDHPGAALADSIMLISIDTKNNKAMMLSIPRDLWVEIPGFGHSKINAASAFGDQDKFSQSGYPEGGMGLLAKTVSQTLELPIHYYAKVNYGAFKDAVNAVGGIDVNIQSSDPRGLYDPNIAKVDGGPLKLTNGPQKLDGQTALNLARARGNPTGDGRYPYGYERSDFTRTQHQRMMLLALKEKLASPTVISNPLKIGELFDVVGKNLKTDFEPGEIRRLYDLNKQIKAESVASVSLNDIGGKNYLSSYRTADGASALIPAAGVDDFSEIQLALKKISSSDPVVREAAKVVILNGGDTTGLATKESNRLTGKGLNVVAVGDAPRQAGANVIIDNTASTGGAKPGTKAKLQQLMGGTVTTTNPHGYPSADFIVILGTNHKPPAETTETTEE